MQTTTQTYTMPAPIAGLFARLPAYPGSWLFTRGLNLVLAPQLPADVREALAGRTLRLRVSDARIVFDFKWQGTAFVPSKTVGTPDLTIGACAHDLLRLARREEDPDTLFFSRRLALEGDTELGLLFKNTLDAFDVSLFDPATFFGKRRPRAS
ncbi:SCP2 sterol-binding domain-containing protein [Massilia solisilvae]|uniref:Ubiquinone biosynthesis accessory factor UbiT n=1 Tax=Massilia solisilvae TaxID=1811225 RepID=A0ABT2BKJ1_9BURK|nr:SCP2 sterol-binding domain-containing protein [Massilia solisilvae]MCS0608403.1 SCP2 sterol-binding domain-containing protein [Massilia solisilvae]